MPPVFQAVVPYPSRRSAEVLKQQLIDHLVATAPRVGDRFVSDQELVTATGLSRPTVRRALDPLQREGWIVRHHGRGTFVGPRVAMQMDTRSPRESVSRPVVRLAVVIHLLGDLQHDWYSRGVISGIDAAAADLGVAIELLGDQAGDVKAVSRRLMLTRPDVLAFVAPTPRHLPLLGECQRLDIAAVGTGTYFGSLGVPSVQEDGEAASADAVQHLVNLGHRRIGLVLSPYATPWVFQRRQGFMNGLRAASLEADEGAVLWLEGSDAEKTASLERFYERFSPTALVFGSYGGVRHLQPLVRAGRIRVPHDCSVIHFDQCPATEFWLEGTKPSVIQIPVVEMGRTVAQLARDIADQRPVEQTVKLSCRIRIAESTAPHLAERAAGPLS